MFSSFKAKLNAVKNDVTTSLKSVSANLPVPLQPKPTSTHYSSSSSLNSSASNGGPETGSEQRKSSENLVFEEHQDSAQDLLHRYEDTWEGMCKVAGDNIKKSKNFSRDLLSTQNKLSTSQKKYKELADEVSHIPAMIKNIQDITGQIADLHSSCALIEDSLLVLENLCEEADFEKSKIAEQQKLAAYDISKKKEQMKYSAKLAQAHKKKVIACEMRQAELRREKELFYQKAFEEDMKRFKDEQKLKEAKQLSEVTLVPDQEDQNQLEDFLGAEGASNNSPSTLQEAESGTAASVVDTSIPQEADKASQVAAVDDEAELMTRARSDTDQSNTQVLSSDGSLEWDENGDDIDMIPDEDNSLESEINDIIRKSTENLSKALDHSSDNEEPVQNGANDKEKSPIEQ